MNAPVAKEGFQQAAPTPPPAAAPAPAAPAPSPEETKDVWPIVVKLSKPIVDQNNRQVTELSFREPTAGDINRCGNPVKWAGFEWSFEERKMTMMIANLSGVLHPMLEKMTSKDWTNCAYSLLRFFVPDPGAW